MTAVMLSIIFQALLEKYTSRSASCMSALVTHKDTEGAPLAFSLENWRGKVPFAAAKGISAVINVQASQLARTAMINPMFIIQLPHVPTARSSTPAVEGVGTAASSCWVINPKGNTDNRTYTMRQPTKPMIVALPTSSWLWARSERTTAPSIPIKAQSVTSMVLFI